PPLDGGGHVLVAGLELELVLGQLFLDPTQCGEEDRDLVAVEDTSPFEAAHVGARPGQVVGCQPAIETEADRERQQLVGRPFLPEPSLPERQGWWWCAWRAAHVSSPRPQRRTKPSA